jgi:hypothetical protein
MRKLLLALALVVSATRASAQVVERPEPFDSAGRLQLITPLVAARLQLQPPAWRITGDYREARLFSSGDGGYVIVVTRRDGAQERYAVTAADRDYLRTKTANLPPGLAEQITSTVTATAREGLQTIQQPSARGAFIVSQSLLGLGVYAPSFAYAITNEDAGRVATYLLVAGGTYFAAASLSRDMVITPPQNVLATQMALSGGAAGWALAYAAEAPNDGRAASIFVGSLAGTAAGLYMGRGMTSADAMAATSGSNALALVAAGVMRATGTLDEKIDGGSPRAAALGLVAAGVLGYPLGARYGRTTAYNVTAGDVGTLWVAGGIGTAAAGTLLAATDVEDEPAIWTGLTAGFAAGVFAGDRLLARRFDHTLGQFGTVTAGAIGGGLMGAGVAVLVDQDDPSPALVLGLLTAGAVTGVGVADWLTTTPADARRTRVGTRIEPRRVRIDATALALAAGKVPGQHALVRVTF